MDLPAVKYELVEWLLSLKDESTVKRLQEIKKETQNFEESYKMSDTERFFLEAGLKDIEEGNTFSHEDVMKEVKEKYGIQDGNNLDPYGQDNLLRNSGKSSKILGHQEK